MYDIKMDTFLKILECGSITKAAEALFVSQSTLSDRLSALETDLNTILIERGPGIKKIQLTPKGIEFLNYANRYKALTKDIDDWKESILRNQIYISGPHSLNTCFFNAFYKEYIDSNSFKLNISSHWNHTIYNMLESYELDFGIVSRPYKSKNIQTIKLFKEPMILVYNSNFADYSKIKNIECLKKTNEINLDWGPDYEIWYQSHWNQNDLPKITVDSPELVLEFLESENAWATLPLCVYNFIKEKDNSIQIIDNFENVYRTIYLVTQRIKSKNIESELDNFLLELREFVKYMETRELCISLF